MTPRLAISAVSLWGGGSNRNYYLNLLRELDRDPRGFDVSVLAPVGMLRPEEVGRHTLVEVRLPERGRTPLRFAYEQTLLPLRTRRFDLLYCPGDIMPAWGRAPVVVALRNLNIYDRRFYDTPRTRILFHVLRLGLRHASGVVCPSRAAADAIAPSLGLAAERVTVVPHGITPAAFDDAPAPPHDAPYVFYPANLERHKNFELLFESLRLVADPRLELWIAGGRRLDPDYAATLDRRVQEMGLESRIRFLDHVPYEQILRYYRGAVALVFPTRLETFGHPLLEAMLAGAPIIASDIPATREVAGDLPLYHGLDDAATLARHIDQIAADPASMRDRIEQGRTRAATYSWQHSIDRLTTLFTHILQRRNTGDVVA